MSIITNLVVGRYVATAPPRFLIGGSVVAVAAALIVIGFAGELWQTSVGMILLGVSSALLLAPATTMIGEQGFRSTPPTLGGSYSLYNLAYAAGLAGGPLFTGFAVQQAGFTAAMIVTAIVLAVFGTASLIRLPATASTEHRIGLDA